MLTHCALNIFVSSFWGKKIFLKLMILIVFMLLSEYHYNTCDSIKKQEKVENS